MAKKQATEQHPNFPSGAWEGFYLYADGPAANRHNMSFILNFRQGQIRGSGSDDIGPFTWAGAYDKGSMSVTMVKSYRTHKVAYSGMADTNGIYGTWELPPGSGGFHIWPKKQAASGKAMATKATKKKLTAV